MSENKIILILFIIALGCLSLIGLRISGRYQLCKNYYSEMGTMECMASDIIMAPQRNK